MRIVPTIDELREILRGWRDAGETVAFVPTMGNLHAGHASLFGLAREQARHVVGSIFVNPLQFGPSEDYTAYPRTLEHDTEVATAQGVELLFTPSVEEMYPRGSEASTYVEVPELDDILCGAFRPGHFRGVATVVVKLLNIVQPDIAIFGEKDYQQLKVIERAVTDLSVPVRVLGAPTVRSEDGLALSSRNRYLSDEERAIAPVVYQALARARQRLEGGDADFAAIEREGFEHLRRLGLVPDYFEVRDPELRKPAAGGQAFMVLTAARLGRARLIDNQQVRVRAGGPAPS
jgi:pantoate--beta-alanine ligase